MPQVEIASGPMRLFEIQVAKSATGQRAKRWLDEDAATGVFSVCLRVWFENHMPGEFQADTRRRAGGWTVAWVPTRREDLDGDVWRRLCADGK